LESDTLPCIPGTPFSGWIASKRKEFGATNANDFILLSMFSLYKSAFECDFNGEDVLALSVKTEAVEALAKGLSARTFPYTMSSSARTPRRAGWGSAAV
jgi:hypothetical protein